ncbi:SusC/RagA family TonB-linked outer membrane protein [Niabella sp. CJ426]|uniref:SusC/RagA family TonB-linked outer membrane protein n=1 Tax=Niabella sp. CJ426 TaxID=3393740 RepID=UPI003D02CF45
MMFNVFTGRMPSWILLVWCSIMWVTSAAQNGQPSVKGTVQNEKSVPVANVTVVISDSTNTYSKTTQTDLNGNFSFYNLPHNRYQLVLSHVGYTTRTVSQQHFSGTALSLNIVLELSQDATEEEVVIVGYGKSKKQDLTGSVKSIKAAEFNQGIINAPEQLLQGKVSGVNITSASGEPGAIQNITVRGPGGIRTGNTPLYVVDGLALDNSSVGGAINPLSFLNPQDIESIDVLKDASATAIYGSRGANGVVIITTRKGKSGFSSLNYSFVAGVSKLANKLPVLNAEQYKKEVVAMGGKLEDFGGNTNWQEEITRTAFTQNHNLALSGGNNGTTYYGSFGMQLQEGILKGNDLKRYTGRLNISQKLLNDRLIIDASINANNTANLRPNIGGLIGGALSTNPTIPAYGSDGKPFQFENGINPLKVLELEKDKTINNRLIGNLAGTLTLLKGLTYKINFGIDNSTATRDIQSLPNTVPLRDGRLETYTTHNKNYLIENYLTFNRSLGDHQFTVLAGHSYQNIFIQGRGNSVNKFPISSVEPIYNPGIGQELTLAGNRPSGYAFENELQSFFSRLNYQFKNRYLFTATFRADGSSKFGANNKYGYFPSLSGAWVVSQEDFYNSSVLTNLKLRAGWGQTGNQEIPPKITQALFTSTLEASYPLYATGAYPGGTTYARLFNPDLQWEVSAQTDIGIDFELLDGKIGGTLDYFRKVTNNILLEVIPADPIQPAPSVWNNVKDMKITNQGFEVDLYYKNTTAGGFSYTIGGNTTFIKNNVTHSPYTVIATGSASGSGLSSATINGYVNNQPIGTFYLLEFIGFDEKGKSRYKDVNGDNVVNDKDRQALGTALPKNMYNFYGNLTWKGIDLVLNFNGVTGNKIYDNTANASFYKLLLSKGVNTTPEAIQYPEEDVNNAAPVSSRFLKSGDFLRLNNLSLGYTFDTRALGFANWIKAMRISLTGQNLFVITPYNGFDPEVNTERSVNGFLSYGIDYLSYPKPRTFQVGLNITL